MMQIGLIGIGAGAAAALLFASVVSGSMLSIFLFYLAPLPIMIAALGWSHWAALIGALGGATALAVGLGGLYFFVFLIAAGAPAWWLGYLTMLARPASAQTSPALEWYPPGRLVVWAALLGAAVVLVAVPSFGTDSESFRAGLRSALEQIMRVDDAASGQTGLPASSATGVSRLIDFLVIAIPPTAAVLTTITNTLNLWLAARIVKFSGRLQRPWPDLKAIQFPRAVLALLAAALVASFLGGLLGIMGGALSASLLMAYGILGFAVLHTLSRGINSRIFLLGGAYAAVVVFGWPILALCLLGITDTVIDIRGRLARKRGPPAPQ
ncbi:MAG: DUF2232 domain-containing protein [Pseudolabrys sp.]